MFFAIASVPFHDFFRFSLLAIREAQSEDPLHQHLRVTCEVQGIGVTQDCVVGVWIQEHRHIAASNSHLQSQKRTLSKCS